MATSIRHESVRSLLFDLRGYQLAAAIAYLLELKLQVTSVGKTRPVFTYLCLSFLVLYGPKQKSAHSASMCKVQLHAVTCFCIFGLKQ